MNGISDPNRVKQSLGVHSALFTGWIRHRRWVPKVSAFRYPIFMWYLNLDQIENDFKKKWYCSVNRFNIVSFFRKDYLGYQPEQHAISELKHAVIEQVQAYYQAHQVAEPSASLNHSAVPSIRHVMLLTHCRFLNIQFNPVSFYYCFDQTENLIAIVAEITNTPWGERHAYVLPVWGNTASNDVSMASIANESSVNCKIKRDRHHEFRFKKQFHVSPFNPMNMDYRWVFSSEDKKLRVHMDNYLAAIDESSSVPMHDDLEKNSKHFDATLVMEQRSFQSELGKTLFKYPFMTLKVVLGIYWQALKLFVNRNPFYDHPSTAKPAKAHFSMQDSLTTKK